MAPEDSFDDIENDIPFHYADEVLHLARQAHQAGDIPLAVIELARSLSCALVEATSLIDELKDRVELLETQISNLEQTIGRE